MSETLLTKEQGRRIAEIIGGAQGCGAIWNVIIGDIDNPYCDGFVIGGHNKQKVTNVTDMSEIYVTEGRKYPLKEAIKLLTNDFIEGENCCHQTIIDLRNAATQLTESNRQLREENKELQATIAARESLIADTMREKVSLETDSEKINECLKLALGDEWNRENPIIVPYLIKRERDQLREELERKQIAYKQVNELLHACNSGSHIQLSERLVIACNKVRTLTTALTAAKGALQTCRCLEPEQREAVADALARIAECEKG